MPRSHSLSLTLARSGGFAGIRPAPVVVNTAELAEEIATQIEKLVAAADFFSLPAELPERKPQPDSFQYSLTVQQGTARHTVTFSEQSAAEPLRELKRLVRECAKR